MSFFDTIILDVILMIFPISSILLFKSYSKSVGNMDKSIFIDIANFFSLFLLIKYCDIKTAYAVMLVNVPLVISILYNRKVASILLAFVLIGFNYYIGDNISIVMIEYLIYIFIVLIKKNRSCDNLICLFVFIKGISLTVKDFYILGNSDISSLIKIFVSLIVFYLVSVLVIKIISKIDDVISLNHIIKELEKEKTLKDSLFKITHEVKNPIAVCKGYLSMMNPEDSKQVRKYNEIILSEINRTLDIMDNFSRYTKIKVELEIMDVDTLISDTIRNMNIIFKENSIKVNYCYDGDEVFVNGDYARLKQVLVNVLKNSVEAIKAEGIIDINLKITKKNVVVSIRDNGPGISEEELDKIGELFYSSKENGCGIGVALCYEIIKLHNGEMQYKSVLGKYTEVIIKLPVVKTLQ